MVPRGSGAAKGGIMSDRLTASEVPILTEAKPPRS
jgi:hypothetical protein